jgi:GINS complex subunit 2
MAGQRYDPQYCPPIYQSEFLASNQLVKINPKFELLKPLQFVSGTYGPFKPSREAVVPLWLALDLKKRGMCEIYPPDWLESSQLQSKLEKEKEELGDFVPLPFHFMEIGKMLVDVNTDYLKGNEQLCDEIRALLRDIDTQREEKIRQGLRSLRQYTSGIKLANLTSLEVHTTRPILSSLFDNLRFLSTKPEDGAVLPPTPLDDSEATQAGAEGSSSLTPAATQSLVQSADELSSLPQDSAVDTSSPIRVAPPKRRRTLRDG